jgi:hypothetical protein
MEFEWQYDEFGGKHGAPPGQEVRLMWSAGWARGVMMVMEVCGMKLEGTNPGQGVLIQESSPSILSIAKREGGKESVME